METSTVTSWRCPAHERSVMWHRELDPIEAVEAADRLSTRPGMAFLDSAMEHGELGRYSYVAADPFGTFSVRSGVAHWNGQVLDGPPLLVLRRLLSQYRCGSPERRVPFQGGCIGYFAYDFGRQLETLATPTHDASACDEVALHFYDVVLAFDHAERQSWLFSSGFPETDPDRREKRALQRLEQVVSWLEPHSRPARSSEGRHGADKWASNFTRQTYMAAVECVKAYIQAGDIYQANISQRFSTSLPAGFDHWRFYRALRKANPAPFAAFLGFGDLTLASSSPERFLRLQDGRVETRPIKGTTKRSPDPALDAAAAEQLLNSEKDRAENVMIVDLLRNDLSRVCAPGSVQVPSLCALESYASVHHLVSVVTGNLREGRDGLDLMAACFPGGSITGAPKLRAMDVITEIERCARGAYCGSIGYIGFDGNADMNIAIRTVMFSGDTAVFQAGGGVTLLSDPESEYSETLAKAQRIFDAFGSVCGTDPYHTGSAGCY